MDHCYTEGCSCTHLIKFPYNAVVELIFVNEAQVFQVGSHPLHMHGYSFRLMGMGQVCKAWLIVKKHISDTL